MLTRKLLMLTAGIIFTGTVSAQGLPVLAELNTGDDLDSVLGDYTFELQMFMDGQGKDYTFEYGIGSVAVDDKTSDQYLNSINLAYKAGLLQAYGKLASTLSTSGVQISTTDEVDVQDSSGDAIRDRLVRDCEEEAQELYALHKLKAERERQEKEEERNSFFGLVKNKLKDDEQKSEEREQLKKELERPEPDFMHTCQAPANTYIQSSSSRSAVSDSLNGGRIWATVYHDGKVGVVVAKSSETTEVAAVLKDQLTPASVNVSALSEVRQRVVEEVGQFPAFPFGLVGTRMMRLSNGEWALYSYGAMQDKGSSSSGFMSSIRSSNSRQGATQQAYSEMSRFSGLMINADSVTEQTAEVRETFSVEVNATKKTHKFKTDQERTVGEVLNFSWAGSSDLNLVGSKEVFAKKFESDGLAFRLVAVAWSPSIMKGNLNKREAYDSAADNAVREGKYNQSKSSGAGPNKSQRTISDQDW